MRLNLPPGSLPVLLLLAALAFAAGLAAAHAGLLDSARARLGQVLGTRAPLPPPDAAAREYRSQRLALYRSLEGSADVVMLGDSHTEGGPWAELLPGRRVLNRGIGWDTSQDVLDRLDEVIARKPQAVFLQIGIVDLRFGHAPEVVAERIEAVAARLRQAGIRPVVQSVLPVAPQLREATNERVRVLNERLRRLPDYLDLHPALVRAGALDPALSYDGVHLSGPAYRLWAREVEAFLARGA
ncbi:GDSL-type esterase/lipase family protein [Ramlibacter rhizophilus]|uniref:SGNH hydrolase-type esterase domain-containing protein n=1 Tax=Ramlibacter rhizophilus TaxID=1781167 RepID=A0A4Z0BC52_9BURK|nr:GDSL-type esterase/lipase family protein [Ramlibacter rhizophilus]TFY96795.1 hypothetical protein EZ242_19110 [Ramlibacter rhizophilus]